MITCRVVHFKTDLKSRVNLYVNIADGIVCDVNEFCKENGLEILQVVQPDSIRNPEYMIGIFKDAFPKQRD